VHGWIGGTSDLGLDSIGLNSFDKAPKCTVLITTEIQKKE
jgi:hypothetical protein